MKERNLRSSFRSHLDAAPSNPSTLPIIPNYLRNPIFPYVTPSSSSPTAAAAAAPDQRTITLLCRIADDPTETDFVEFDFPKEPNSGSYDRLRSLISEELNLTGLDRLRRLPCVRLRHDRDVERLKDNDMLEVLLPSSSKEKNPS